MKKKILSFIKHIASFEQHFPELSAESILYRQKILCVIAYHDFNGTNVNKQQLSEIMIECESCIDTTVIALSMAEMINRRKDGSLEINEYDTTRGDL